ncbi:MAG: hypothetical protein PHR25_01690 [Clostridia bacterium]|nr:hypothetical protein [Clostridia bacterium]MDD4375474.1 hypothetical protein [Clostridia bacterium]
MKQNQNAGFFFEQISELLEVLEKDSSEQCFYESLTTITDLEAYLNTNENKKNLWNTYSKIKNLDIQTQIIFLDLFLRDLD